ncbi:hypothetical protein XA68_18523 [Ophiocordyceps unilateralis]|uniref:Aromatic-L-amino-acid decarboxylase n=1 Tax=Ophiocordyceps unilateralis TaxID=268505 RepID=A0A2A9PHX1_OPHUN|nr:hypothetical protein XA68_18523 [Ophiocordyceps unilateralis]
MNTDEYRRVAKAAVDDIADYLESIPGRPVVAAVEPSYLAPLLPTSAPLEPEPLEAIMADVRDKIMPGITQWASPRFMAFFPSSTSTPAAVAEMWSGAFNGAHFNWICSPAVTELEVVVLDWTARLLSLPTCFLSDGPTNGGGVILGSASEAIVTVMAAARDRFVAARAPDGNEEEQWRLRSRLVALGSSGAHSSTRKAAQVLGLRYVAVAVAEADGFALQGPALAHELDRLAAAGLEPFFLTATLGSTDVCAVDDLAAVAEVLKGRDVWVHVDAAYAGAALVLDEYKPLTEPLAAFDSFNFNPHKWLLTNFSCSTLWVRDRAPLVSAMSVEPPYLRNRLSDAGTVIDFRHWQIPLGRRFRSLKLWFVLRAFGVRGLQHHVSRGIRLAEGLEEKLRSRRDLFVVFTPARFGLVTFRAVVFVAKKKTEDKEEEEGEDDAVNARTAQLLADVTAAAEYFLTSTVVNGKFAIRVATGGQSVREKNVDGFFDHLVERAERLGDVSRSDRETDAPARNHHGNFRFNSVSAGRRRKEAFLLSLTTALDSVSAGSLSLSSKQNNKPKKIPCLPTLFDLIQGDSSRIVMAFYHSPSSPPHAEFHTPPSEAAPRDKPSPLRIVKRAEQKSPFETTTTAAAAMVPLKVAKRRSVEADSSLRTDSLGRRGGGRIWGDALMRCRGLLARSTPSFREAWRHGAHRGTSGCRAAWSDSDSDEASCDSDRRLSYARPVSTPASRASPSLVGENGSPSVLCPCIAVTSEAAGDGSIWAAVEVSGRADRFFEYGCLYDLSVAIEPTPGSTIVRVIQEQAFPTTIYAGSSVLLVVHVQTKARKAKRRNHVREKSDELMEDLELQLGSGSGSGFMNVRVSYSHSAFPEHKANVAGGVLGLRSRMETTAGATLSRRQGGSSPRVLPLVHRHWGADRAVSIRALMQTWRRAGLDLEPGSLADDDSPGPASSRASSVPPPPESKDAGFWSWGTWF